MLRREERLRHEAAEDADRRDHEGDEPLAWEQVLDAARREAPVVRPRASEERAAPGVEQREPVERRTEQPDGGDHGVDRERAVHQQILADERLSAAERAVLEQYFAQPEGTHPLDFAARRLRTNTAMEHLESARETFEAELIAMPVSGGDYETVEKLNRVAQSQGGAFDAARIAQDLRGAMDQIGTDEALIFSSLRGLTPLRGAVVRKFYRARYDRDLDFDLALAISAELVAISAVILLSTKLVFRWRSTSPSTTLFAPSVPRST